MINIKAIINQNKDLLEINKRLNEHHFKLYLVGGALRDLLINDKKIITDWDFGVDATPQELIDIFKDYQLDYYQEALGSIKIHLHNQIYELTSLRKEEGVKNLRYPTSLFFVKDPLIDSYRRDFTVNALYYDLKDDVILDYHQGIIDLNNHYLRFIGDVKKRIIEDPIRIVRAFRFSMMLGFKIIDLDIIIKELERVIQLGIIKYQELYKILKIKSIIDIKEYLDYFLIMYPELPIKDFIDNYNMEEKYLSYLYLNKKEIFNNLIIDKETRKRIKKNN